MPLEHCATQFFQSVLPPPAKLLNCIINLLDSYLNKTRPVFHTHHSNPTRCCIIFFFALHVYTRSHQIYAYTMTAKHLAYLMSIKPLNVAILMSQSNFTQERCCLLCPYCITLCEEVCRPNPNLLSFAICYFFQLITETQRVKNVTPSCISPPLWPSSTSHHAVLSARHLSIHFPCQSTLPVSSSLSISYSSSTLKHFFFLSVLPVFLSSPLQTHLSSASFSVSPSFI